MCPTRQSACKDGNVTVFHQNKLYLKRDLIYSTCYKHSVTQMPCLNCHSKPTKKPNVLLYRNYQKHFHCLNNSVVENLLWAWVGVGSVPSHVILKTLKWYQLTPLTWTLWPCLGQVFFLILRAILAFQLCILINMPSGSESKTQGHWWWSHLVTVVSVLHR